VSDLATTLPDSREKSSPVAAASPRRRKRQRLERLRAFILGAGFPILLILIWDRAVAVTGTRLIPSPYQVALMMYDFTFGGIYDDAFSGTILIHVWKSMQRVYGGFLLAALIGVPLGLMIGRIKVLRQLLAAAPDSCHRVAPALDDLLRIGTERGDLSGVSRRVLSDPAEHHVRRALDRSTVVRGRLHARLFRRRHVPANRVAGLASGDLQWP
jgi:hypothetical protein